MKADQKNGENQVYFSLGHADQWCGGTLNLSVVVDPSAFKMVCVRHAKPTNVSQQKCSDHVPLLAPLSALPPASIVTARVASWFSLCEQPAQPRRLET